MSIHLPAPITKVDWVRGPEDAAATVVHYGDFQCPDSAAAARVLQILAEHAPGKFRLVFRHLPLTDIHRHALDAAKAAEAAGAAGHFWKMHDQLFEASPNLSLDNLAAYAEQIGLKREDFLNSMDSSDTNSHVHEDLDAVRAIGLGSTPTLFVNGKLYTGPVTVDALHAAFA